MKIEEQVFSVVQKFSYSTEGTLPMFCVRLQSWQADRFPRYTDSRESVIVFMGFAVISARQIQGVRSYGHV